MGNKKQLEFILESLEQADTLAGLQTASEDLQRNLGIKHVAYHWVDSAGDQYGCGTYSLDWQARYIEQNYVRIDPVISGCFQRFHPVDWKQLDWSSKATRAFQAEAIEYGVGNQGYSIPVRGPNGQFALFTVNDSCEDDTWATFTEDKRPELILIAHFLNEKALDLEPGRTPEAVQPLSPREVDAITLLAIGYSRAQVADSLSISEHTLRVYIESARFKLGAINTTHAVARALSRGLIVV
ncbi:Autoinducer-binding transcriptional regulator LuxR [Sulfitobacter noctilucicola]|uniref:DNA-binding CsgD family transcriptional regulator n=1 Tax=Sulfitobacter noctilucicola TaxID=1342301 RepID=A0A7W6M992_9RHOB|nr:autoinducer binding domain-containing protein [Sulfitobacter noctilucicola]KIN63698.1 Autoinducer-binding transcriptional regulator LuxR [Sulfitobacter noctilucicola]MBB4174791.1 DNA-binding CsgD family transcriptional regulator [Sulfitobacter noctilucicola]